VKRFLSPENPKGIPPLPNSILLNEGLDIDYTFEKGKRYRFRIISYACFASAMFRFGSHSMKVIMADGEYVEKQTVEALRITPAQRFDVIIEPNEINLGNNPILVSLDSNRDWTNKTSVPPISWPLNSTAYLLRDPEGDRPEMSVSAWEPFDDAHLRPLTPCTLPTAVKTLEFNWKPCVDQYGIHRYEHYGSDLTIPRLPNFF
jgi:iron transport multicopper oxidase